MTIQTDYGAVEYSPEDLITFSDGIFGFPKLTDYLLLRMGEGAVLFVLINPFFLCSDYSPSLAPQELDCLDVKDSGDLSYYVICVVRDEYLENTVNLKCPLAINPQTRCGIQLILENGSYEYCHRLGDFPSVIEG